jgi:glycosyltransferase involved in cell wall biosynthesis
MLTIGVLEPGREKSGIRRYGEVIAAGLRDLDDTVVTEVPMTLAGRGRGAISQARRLVHRLSDVDVAILPYTRFNVWSPSAIRLLQLAVVHLALRRRTVTVLHDVYRPGSPRRLEWWTLLLVLLISGRTVVHSEHERRELSLVPFSGRVRVVPHFVVERALRDRQAARASFDVAESTTVVGLIGWMNPRKNYELAIEALAQLPDRFELWLIGGIGLGLDWYAASLQEVAVGLGVQGRVRVTGSVSEEELERRLAALDAGVCPYHRISASGSMSTLLGAHRPVVVSDVEFARELRTLAPDVVHTFARFDAQTLAGAIETVAATSPAPGAFAPILRERSVALTAGRYRALAMEVAGTRPQRNGIAATVSRS